MGQGEVLRTHRPFSCPVVADNRAGRDALESYMIIEELPDGDEDVMISSDGPAECSNGVKTKGSFSLGHGHVVASHRIRSLLDSPRRRKIPSESHTSRNHREEAWRVNGQARRRKGERTNVDVEVESSIRLFPIDVVTQRNQNSGSHSMTSVRASSSAALAILFASKHWKAN